MNQSNPTMLDSNIDQLCEKENSPTTEIENRSMDKRVKLSNGVTTDKRSVWETFDISKLAKATCRLEYSPLTVENGIEFCEIEV